MDPSTLLQAAQASLGRGEVPEAIISVRQAVEAGAGAAARELLGGLLMFDDDLEGARRELELAFREWREAGEMKAAALTAATLADLHTSWFGNRIVGSGWAARARRLVEPEGRCVELGHVELAVLACEAGDVRRVEEAAERALELAREFSDPDLEVRALADSGYALVLQGRTGEGFRRLDEAMAALSAGEVRHPAVACMSFCALLAACERTGDGARAEEWTRVVAATMTDPLGSRPRALHTHCRLVYGSVLCTTGRWSEGEAALLEAIGPNGSGIYTHRAEAAVRLASLRLVQGRVEEALQLVSPCDERPGACEVLARVHLARGELDRAAAVAIRALGDAGGDQLRAVALRSLLVEIEVGRGDLAAATDHAEALARLADDSDSDLLRAEAALAAGRVAAARFDGDRAVEALHSALALADHRPLLRAVIALDLAQALADLGREAEAIDHASLAGRTLERLNGAQLLDRANALLRSLGATGRPPGRSAASAVAGLTAREQQVLALVRDGLTNAEIGERLYISAKTAEHHVSRVLAKLGVRSRAEAAGVATAAMVGPEPG